MRSKGKALAEAPTRRWSAAMDGCVVAYTFLAVGDVVAFIPSFAVFLVLYPVEGC